MSGYGIALLFVLAGVFAEQLILTRRGHAPDWHAVVANLNSGHVIMWLGRLCEIAAYGAVLSFASTGWVASWPVPAQWVFAVLAWDFLFYLMHVAHHHIPILWSVHCVHHHGQTFDLGLGVRNSWYSSLSATPFVLPLAVLGVPLDVFAGVSSLLYTHQLLNHTGLVDRAGILDRFFVTPSNHRVHHYLDRRCWNRNFGGTLLLWDKLFGTHQPELPDMARAYGVDGITPPANPLVASHGPLRRRFAPDPKRRRCGPAWTAVAGALLFALVALAILRDGTDAAQAWLFAAITAGTLALGALSDGARWAWPAWCAWAWGAMPLWIGVCGTPGDEPLVVIAAACAAHTAYAVLLRRAARTDDTR